MSSSTTSDSLSKAYRLIEADELAAARAVLEPILASEPDNVDAWWMYAHAVADTLTARKALDEVMRLDPDYPGAAELMEQLEVVTRSEAETEPLPVTDMDFEPVFDEGQFDDEDEEDELLLDDEPVIAPVHDDLRDSVNTSTRRSWVPIAALVAIVALVLIAAVLLLQPPPPEPGTDVVAVPSPTVEVGIGVVETEAVTEEPVGMPPPTQEESSPVPAETEPVMIEEPVVEEPTEALEPTDAATEELPVMMPTEETTDAAPVEASSTGATQVAMLPAGEDFTPLVDALAEFAVAPEDVAEMETSLGDTVVVTVCATSSATLRQNLPAVMDVIASRAAVVAGEAEAIGARLVNCETDHPLIFVAVPKEQAVAYAVGNLTAEDFQATWRPQ